MPKCIPEKPLRSRKSVPRIQPVPQPSTPRLISIQDAADALSLSPWCIRHWATVGKLVSVKLGTRTLIPASELDRIVAEGTRRAVRPGGIPARSTEAA